MRTFFKIFVILLIAGGIVFIVTMMPKSDESGDNTDNGISASGGVILNEAMSANKGYYPGDKGASSDWVELYNDTDKDINMSSFTLSDDETNPIKWPFPSVTLKAHEYMVVFLTGDSNNDLKDNIIHCSFKLSSAGEKLTLFSVSGQVVDSVDIPALGDNTSYARMNGQWQTSEAPTPGFENSDSGLAAFKQKMTAQGTALKITEVMTNNSMTVKDENGLYDDWVEVTNTGEAAVNLNGWGLSDDAKNSMKWRFPDYELKAGQSAVVFCSGDEKPGTLLHADFKLSSMNCTVTLADASGRVADSVNVNDIPSDYSYARQYSGSNFTDTWSETSKPTPGYPNTDAGFADFLAGDNAALGDIVISEVLTSNNKIDTNGSKSDYIEVENRGGSAVNLRGYGLTDNASNPGKFRFPDVTLQPGKSVYVIAAGADAAKSGALYAPFKLSRLGGTVALFNSSDELLDRYFIGVMPENISIGREEGQSALLYFDTPTPGAPNGNGKKGVAQEVVFSEKPGEYARAVTLTLTSPDGCDIYYTTDKGATPTQSSTKYTGPITISATTAVKARAIKDDYISSGTATATYLINTNHTLPVVSIVTEDKNLNDPATGIYVNSKKDVEVPASFEMYDESGQRVFQQDIGLQMTGGETLRLKEQKSLAIYARSKYGDGTMAYPFFSDRGFTEYKSIILRTAGREGGMVTKLNNYVALKLVDGQMHVMTQAAKPCVVYINGKYWGIYFMMEKRNKYMVAQHEGVTDKDVIDTINLAKGNGGNVNNGSGQGYKDIYNYIKSHDMTLKESFDWVAARMDTDSYMDFMVNEVYIANHDAGNLQAYQMPPDGKWIQVYQDLDISFYSFETIKYRRLSSTPGSDIFNGMLKYKPWRDEFIDRMAWALKNIYNKDRVTAAIDEAAALIRGEVAAEHERWSDERPTLEAWEAGVNALKYFAKIRGKAVVNELKQQFTLTDAQKQMLDDAIK